MASPVVKDDRTADGSPDWGQIQEEWRRREFGALRGEVLALPGIGLTLLERLDGLLFPPPPQPKEEQATERPPEVDPQEAADPVSVLTDAFQAVRPDDRPLLALWVYGLCLQKLEQSEDYDRIRTVRNALSDVGNARWQNDAALAPRALIRRIVSQAQVVDATMDVEDAMSCSCPVAMNARATDIVNRLETLEALPELESGDDLADLRDFVRCDAERNLLYFGTIAAVARGMCEFVQLDASDRAGYDFDAVLTALTKAEADSTIKGDVYESELRAHRIALQRLSKRAGAPYLWIDAAELAYLYPLALANDEEGKEIDPTVTVERALDRGFARVNLNDIWEPEGGEPRDENADPRRDYSGASFELPKIAVETTAKDRLVFTAEVRLSRLGNHHVRIRSRVEDRGLHELNQALRRGSHGMGDERFEGLDEVSTFRGYAEAIIERLACLLGAEAVVNLNAPYHIVLAARSIFVQSDGKQSPAQLEHLKAPEVVGTSLLFHPVRHLTTALNEWIRYPPPTVINLLERQGNAEDPVARADQGYIGDLVVRTDNTTVTFMPATPEWLVDEYVEMIEFVASIPPLFTLWERAVDDLTREVDKELQQSKEQLKLLATEKWLRRLWHVVRDVVRDVVLRRRGSEGGDPTRRLYENEMKIRELESDIREHLGTLHSPALCRTRAHRQFLDNLWKAAGLPALENELERRLSALAERQKRIAATVSSIEQDVRRRLERPLTLVIGLLAVASLAELFSLINQLFDVGRPVWGALELAVLFAAFGLIGVLYLYISHGKRSPGP